MPEVEDRTAEDIRRAIRLIESDLPTAGGGGAVAVLRRCLEGLSSDAAPNGQKRGIYIASKTKHGLAWRILRARGVPIISTWIDEAEQGATSDWPDLWRRCVSEASNAAALIVYREADEVLKGAWVEVGAALASGTPVYAVGCEEFSVRHHAGVRLFGSIDDAFKAAVAVANGGEHA